MPYIYNPNCIHDKEKKSMVNWKPHADKYRWYRNM